MILKNHTVNVYRHGAIVGSITATAWFFTPSWKVVKRMKIAATGYYGKETVIADYRRF